MPRHTAVMAAPGDCHCWRRGGSVWEVEKVFVSATAAAHREKDCLVGKWSRNNNLIDTE